MQNLDYRMIPMYILCTYLHLLYMLFTKGKNRVEVNRHDICTYYMYYHYFLLCSPLLFCSRKKIIYIHTYVLYIFTQLIDVNFARKMRFVHHTNFLLLLSNIILPGVKFQRVLDYLMICIIFNAQSFKYYI